MNAVEEHAIVILAAGASSRMGQPKQLLEIKGKTLLRHVAEEAISASIGPVIVVVGAFSELVEKAIKDISVKKVVNLDWKQGMGTSIQKGILEVQNQYPHCQGAILMLSDQPYVDATLLNKLLQAHLDSKKPIVASSYQNTLGVPVYFHASYFPHLCQLEGFVGARKLIRQHKEKVERVDFPSGKFDIDTPEDYQKIKKKME
ncbi:molybdenum cofactor cytidylyltransferase [Catalinimonas alkaloidigena]|uniref:nucleotidyltransferase family protein n=1 Tax=Catalinimonas alkaloidigena TaxID=1075417 RepID=UPI00240521FC|nr:nucleotidyltransferase family protein [Catalinimonas alkaloidigena]MDF9799960.1 molybdenum cofactor cytidylyltransferase [Catalinimonas alkaloidigena]